MNRRKSLKLLGVLGVITLVPFQSFSTVIENTCNRCKTAWKNLSELSKKKYQFRYIEPLKGLPNVILYGDSISIGYTEYVRSSLEGKANVQRIHLNGGSSGMFINNMEKLRKTMFQPVLKAGWDFDWDVIHFNVGLHDLKYILDGKLNKVDGIQVSSLKDYEKNLHEIIKFLKKQHPNAKLIFATTTPVPEGADGRFANDDKRYNKVALKVLNEYKNIVINNLGEFSIPIIKKYGRSQGNVHYMDEGSRIQGIEVARHIGNVLGIKPNVCKSVAEIKNKMLGYPKK